MKYGTVGVRTAQGMGHVPSDQLDHHFSQPHSRGAGHHTLQTLRLDEVQHDYERACGVANIDGVLMPG